MLVLRGAFRPRKEAAVIGVKRNLVTTPAKPGSYQPMVARRSITYCIEVQDPEELHGLRHMLATEELFLNFTGEIKGNTLYDLVYKHILGRVSTIKVTPQNKYLKSVDGILYSKDGKTLSLAKLC